MTDLSKTRLLLNSQNFGAKRFSVLYLLGLKALFRDPILLLWIGIPLILGAAVGVYGLFAIWGQLDFIMERLHNFVSYFGWFEWIVSWIPWVFKTLFSWIIGIFVSTLYIYIAFIFIQIVSSPFYSLAVERYFRLEKIPVVYLKSTSDWAWYSLRMLRVSLIKSLFFGVIGVILFILTFIPGLNFFSPYFTSFVMAYDSYDYSLELFNYGFNDRMGFISKHAFDLQPMTLYMLPAALIPGVALFLMPLSVLGGAVVITRIIQSKNGPVVSN